MWNSPKRTSEEGKRYTIQEVEALVYPLDQLLISLELTPVADVVSEPMLKRMEKGELIYSLYEVMQALLEGTPIPMEGHAGYQEAIVAELLDQTCSLVECELGDPESGDSARLAALRSFKLLAAEKDEDGKSGHWLLDDIAVDLDSEDAHCSEQLTADVWSELLVHPGGLWDEFFWDHDWRIEKLLDVHPAKAEAAANSMGIDMETVHRSPHSPTSSETKMALHYLRYIIFESEAENP